MGNTLNVRDLILIAIFSLAATLVLTPIVRALALRFGLVDKPGPRRMHRHVMPTAGGLAVFIGVWLPVLVMHGWGGFVPGLFIASLFIVVLGIIDDYIDLRPGVKLAGQVLAAGVLVYSGARIETVGHPLGGAIELAWLSGPVTLFWLVAVTNALNIIDGLDGLASGVATIAAVPLLFISVQLGQWSAALVAAALIGSAVGFLRYNFHPAKVFIGDTGGMFLGFMLGAVVVEGVLTSGADVALSVPVLVLGLPLFDTACAIVRRAAAGKPISQADDGHLHHQLVRVGLTHRQVVLALYAVGALLAALSTILLRATALQAFFVAVAIAAGALPWAKKLGVLGEFPPRRAMGTGVRRSPAPPASPAQQRSEKA